MKDCWQQVQVLGQPERWERGTSSTPPGVNWQPLATKCPSVQAISEDFVDSNQISPCRVDEARFCSCFAYDSVLSGTHLERMTAWAPPSIRATPVAHEHHTW